MIDIKIKFTGDKKLQELIYAIDNDLLYDEAQEAIPELAKKTAENMQQNITESKKRPATTSKNLENNIKEELIYDIGGISYGIGNKDTLKLNAPYYEVLNDGGYVPPANIGYFGNSFRAPEAGGSGEHWNHTGKGSGYFYMKPKKAIEGIHYIEKAALYLENEVRQTIKNIVGKLLIKLLK